MNSDRPRARPRLAVLDRTPPSASHPIAALFEYLVRLAETTAPVRTIRFHTQADRLRHRDPRLVRKAVPRKHCGPGNVRYWVDSGGNIHRSVEREPCK